MGLIRLIIIIALAWLVWRLIKATLARSGRGGPLAPRGQDAGEKMLRCAHCGVHVPASAAFRHGEHAFCSQDHQRAYLEDHHD